MDGAGGLFDLGAWFLSRGREVKAFQRFMKKNDLDFHIVAQPGQGLAAAKSFFNSEDCEG